MPNTVALGNWVHHLDKQHPRCTPDIGFVLPRKTILHSLESDCHNGDSALWCHLHILVYISTIHSSRPIRHLLALAAPRWEHTACFGTTKCTGKLSVKRYSNNPSSWVTLCLSHIVPGAAGNINVSQWPPIEHHKCSQIFSGSHTVTSSSVTLNCSRHWKSAL